MQIDWTIIKRNILLNCTNAFNESSLSITDAEIDEAFIIFRNFIVHPMPECDDIRGLESDFCEALMNCCTTGVGSIHYLETISTDFEAFYKKILIVTGRHLYVNLRSRTWMLWNLNNELQLCPNFRASGQGYSNVDIETLKYDSEACYIIFNAYRSRNSIHNAPKLDLAQWASYYKYCVSTYIWVIHKYKSQLLSAIPSLNKSEIMVGSIDKENRYLFDFLGFGKTPNELKNQIVNSFILNKIYNEEDSAPVKVSVLTDEVLAFSQNTLNPGSVKRFLDSLEAKQKISFTNYGKTEVVLTENEKARIYNLSQQYNETVNDIKLKIAGELASYGIAYDLDRIVAMFSDFFDDNFNKEIELEDNDGDNTKYNNYAYLLKSIQSEGFSEEQASEIFKKVIVISKSNNILYKLSLGRAFGKISNKLSFSNYYQAQRTAFLDTQIVLYILCLHEDLPKPTLGLASIAYHLVEKRKNNNQIELLYPKVYKKEVFTHFKRALSLLSFTRNKNVDGRPISNNVFYRYYCTLKADDQLPDEVESFEDYLDNMFELREEDLYDEDLYTIVTGIVDSILDENKICIYNDIPFYSDEELKPSIDTMLKVIKNNSLDKTDDSRLKSDAIVGHFLFNNNFEVEPFFLTLDRSFKPYKEAYISKYKRIASKSIYWHLCSPSQFVNHLDLINLQIDEDRLSNELLSLIESDGYDYKTHTTVDNLCRLMDVQNLDKEQKDRNMKSILKQLVGTGEYDKEIEIIANNDSPEIKRFCEVSNEVMTLVLERGGQTLEHYNELFREDAKFNTYVGLVKKYAKENIPVDYYKLLAEIECIK